MTGSLRSYDELRAFVAAASAEDVLDFAASFLDQNCGFLDAQYGKAALIADGDEVGVALKYALLGSAIAQFSIGMARLHGLSSPANPGEGIFWLRRSYGNGNLAAALAIASAYHEGTGVSKNPVKAAGFACEAAEKGSAKAQYVFACYCIEGLGVPRNNELALFWLQESAKSRYQPAIDLLRENDDPEHPACVPPASGSSWTSPALGPKASQGEAERHDRRC